jgi:hypothetical protein
MNGLKQNDMKWKKCWLDWNLDKVYLGKDDLEQNTMFPGLRRQKNSISVG